MTAYAKFGIEKDVKVVNNRPAALDDRLAADTRNKPGASLGLERDIEDDRLTIVDNELAIRDDRLVVDNDKSVAKIGKKNRYR